MNRGQGIASDTKYLQSKVLSIAMQIDSLPQNETTTKPPGFKRYISSYCYLVLMFHIFLFVSFQSCKLFAYIWRSLKNMHYSSPEGVYVLMCFMSCNCFESHCIARSSSFVTQTVQICVKSHSPPRTQPNTFSISDASLWLRWLIFLFKVSYYFFYCSFSLYLNCSWNNIFGNLYYATEVPSTFHFAISFYQFRLFCPYFLLNFLQ